MHFLSHTLTCTHTNVSRSIYGKYSLSFYFTNLTPSPVGELKTGQILSIMLEQNMCPGKFKTVPKIHWAKMTLYTISIYYQPNTIG